MIKNSDRRDYVLDEKEAVRDFLEQVKGTITKPPGDYQAWVLVLRPENRECITTLGFGYKDVREAILGLSVADYCEGPLHDRDMPGDLWVFGKVIEGREVYIKLKLAILGNLRMVRIVSFHFAQESLCYPFREQKKREVN